MIRFVEGDFFDYDADIRINTVNCVGVMGAGVALAFKNKFPDMYREYKNACNKGEIRPGRPHVWSKGDMFSKQLTIINFPTKDHWRKPSTYEYVEDGLIWLREYLLRYSDESTITVPALGCGHGGLDWTRVKSLIVKYLGDLKINTLVFEPVSSQQAPDTEDFDFDLQQRYRACNLKILKPDSSDYPELLKQWSDRTLFVKGNISFNSTFDISLIVSSDPSEEEREKVQEISKKLILENKSVFVGPSKFEQQILKLFTNNHVNAGISLPSGILKKCEDGLFSKEFDLDYLAIYSIGDPLLDFDRKNFIPSTLLRLHMSKDIIITTSSISWISKYKKHFFENKNVYYVKNRETDSDEMQILINLGAKPFVF